MAAKIKNINQLREHAIETLERLEKGKIDCTEAGVTAKLYESVIASVKIELEYNRMTDKIPNIAFIEDGGSGVKTIGSVRQLRANKDK
jgi:hypothetical protein